MTGFFEGRQLVIATVHTKKKWSSGIEKRWTPNIARFAILEKSSFFKAITPIFNFLKSRPHPSPLFYFPNYIR